ncbi:MAG TPA: hypothetical protein VN783_12380 [Thermoanaerobaculia bacterium]|nr:hypothetical protein [Thermoanaerobaculia bacterium]
MTIATAKIRRALEAYRKGTGSLAYAAEQAGVPLREMALLARAQGIEPRVLPDELAGEITPERAARL